MGGTVAPTGALWAYVVEVGQGSREQAGGEGRGQPIAVIWHFLR